MGVVPQLLVSQTFKSIMKIVCLLLSALLVPSLADVTCDDCQTATGALIDRLLSEDSIAEQVTIVGATVCPSLPDPAGCEEYLATWWGDAADCLFNFIADSNPCGTLGFCKRRPTPCPRTGPVTSALMCWPACLPTCRRLTPSPWGLRC